MKLFEALFLEETQTYGYLKETFADCSSKLSLMSMQVDEHSTADSNRFTFQ